MVPRPIRRQAFALALLAVALPNAAAAQKVPESLVTSAGTGGHERVIVVMASPAEGGRQESYRQPERHLENILRGTARLVDGIGSQPLAVAEVNREGLARLERDPSVRRVLPDTLMRAFLADSTKLLGVPPVWTAGTKGSGVSIAVLDTGVDRAHPFLSGRIVAEACFSSISAAYGSKSLCPNGQAEQIGAGAGAACDHKAVTPNCVHGTHVAGIAAGASGRTEGGGTIDGVAPQAGIVAVQVFSRFDGEKVCGQAGKTCINAWTSDVLKGLLFVKRVAERAKVAAVNLSLGGGKNEGACDARSAYADVIDRLTKRGIPVVAAAGNEGLVGAVVEPACIASAVTVGATNKEGAVDTRYSNTSAMIDFVAPGTDILSSAAGGYHKVDGTSMAAPHVAGVLALLRVKHPKAPVDGLLAALRASGAMVTDARNNQASPLPNAEAAMAVLGGGAVKPVPPKPDPGPARPPQPAPDPRISSCGPVCVEIGDTSRRVIFVLADRNAVSRETLTTLRTLFGASAKVEDIGDGKLVVELPQGTTGSDVDRARRSVGDGTRVVTDQPLQTLQPGGRIQIR